MAEARNRGAAGTVEDLAAIGLDEPDTMTADRDRRRFAQTTMQDAGFLAHDLEFSSGTY
jgi:hypothetical protein